MPTSSTTSAAWRRAEARLRAWFATLERKPAPFQRAAWRAWADGRNGLIHAPTGTGKTLAAVGGPLIDAVLHPERGLQLLWITPLRSLATDTAQHLSTAVTAMELPWRVLRRTGDSTSGERAKLRRGDCELLVTTPESLALLLSYPDAADRFKHLRGVVVDEWHELIGNKRGTLLQLGLARVRALRPQPAWVEWISLLLAAYSFAVLFRAHRRDYPLVMMAAVAGYVISRYNRSPLYSMAVWQLSQEIATGVANAP